MMKVINIDFENKTFETDNGETFPLMFDVNESITLEEFQELVDKSENARNELKRLFLKGDKKNDGN